MTCAAVRESNISFSKTQTPTYLCPHTGCMMKISMLWTDEPTQKAQMKRRWGSRKGKGRQASKEVVITQTTKPKANGKQKVQGKGIELGYVIFSSSCLTSSDKGFSRPRCQSIDEAEGAGSGVGQFDQDHHPPHSTKAPQEDHAPIGPSN
ncbi:hypothetical protein K438DRAFT_1747536 [Mycena galopus ATCC 62051]|nr:hypothetical protein K438DRAFT_1747536 [Mycena galopus ATCC 62051]